MIDIRFDPDTSRQVTKFVVRRFFSLREIPQAVWYALFTREFLFLVLIPVSLIVVGLFVESVRYPLAGVAIAWLVTGLILVLRRGRNRGIGCYSGDELLGGLVFKYARGTILFSGILIKPDQRGRGIFAALLLAAFRMASTARRISIFAPGHPASRRVVEKYFHGRQEMTVDREKGSEFLETLAMLEAEVEGREIRFQLPEGGLNS